MKSSRQRKTAIKTARKQKTAKRIRRTKVELAAAHSQYIAEHVATGALPVNPSALAPTGSYSDPEFLTRGTYLDLPFTCIDCGEQQVWTASQQKWWYEVANGDRFSSAVRCRPCRRKEQARKREARRIHLDGVAAKKVKAQKS